MLREIFEEHARVLEQVQATLLGELEQAAELTEGCLRNGGKLLILGNGGSAADAQHFAAELVGRFERERRAMPALALTTNGSTVTAVGNDFGYAQVFERQVEAFCSEGDVLIAISTSGNSENVVLAAKRARELGCPVVALTGEGGGQLAEWTDVLIAVPSRVVSRVQEMHEICLHALAAWIEKRVGGEQAERMDHG